MLRVMAATSITGMLALTGCGITGPAHTEPPLPAVDATVEMGFTRFMPETIRIKEGQTVQWRNTSPITHTVTADPELAADPTHVQLPEDAEQFNSGEIQAGQVWKRTFTVPGLYRYVCLPHEDQGMIGTVIVEPQ